MSKRLRKRKKPEKRKKKKRKIKKKKRKKKTIKKKRKKKKILLRTQWMPAAVRQSVVTAQFQGREASAPNWLPRSAE